MRSCWCNRPPASISRAPRFRSAMRRPWRAAAATAAALVIVSGCGRRGGDQPAAAPRIELDARDSRAVVVSGLSEADLARLRGRALTADEWTAFFRVVV